MVKLTSHQIVILFLGLGIMLALARVLGELFNKYKQPAIVGELIAGVLLGPTVFGALFPNVFAVIFPMDGVVAFGYQTIINLAVVLLLLIAGLEIDLSIVLKQGKAAILVSLFGVFVPFIIGFGAAYAAPLFWGMEPGADALTFSLFIGIALSISALPVIAKIMLDLNLFKTDVGMLVMGAAMLNDLIGWFGFSIVLGMIGIGGESGGGFSIKLTIGLTVALYVVALTAGRYLVDKVLPWIQAQMIWPGGILGFTLVLMLLGASLTEFIGVHAVFGAFLVGIIVGDSPHLREKTRTILNQFVTYIFAPIFLVAIGLEANFLDNFRPFLILAILVVAFAGKFGGCLLGGWLGGLTRRDNLAVSFGMNARGTMEIILALLALQHGVIGEDVFVALIVLAVLSSLVAGPFMQHFIKREEEWRLEDLISEDTFVRNLQAKTREGVIRELAEAAADKVDLEADEIAHAVLARERLISSSIGFEVAVPQANVEGLETPVIAVGYSREDLDFDSPEGNPTHLVFLLLTDLDDTNAKMQIMDQIAGLFKGGGARKIFYDGESMDVIRAYIKTGGTSNEEKDYGMERDMQSILREKGMREEDPYEKVTGRAGVIDIDDGSVSYDKIVREACSIFAQKLDKDEKELYNLFSEKRDMGAIPIGRGTALKHVRVEEDISPEIVLVRIKNGLAADKEYFEDLNGSDEHGDQMLYALIFLVSSEEHASRHLRFMAHIVEMVDNKRFLKRWRMAKDKPALRHLILRGERFISFTLRKDNRTEKFIGKQIKDIDLPGESLISILKRHGKIKIPHGDTQLNEGDRLLVVGERENIQELKKLNE